MKFERVEDIFAHFNIELSQLPDSLQRLIEKLEKASQALSAMDMETKKQFFPVLMHTAEIIHKEVQALNLLPPASPDSRIDKQKQLELEKKAQAILLRKQRRA